MAGQEKLQSLPFSLPVLQNLRLNPLLPPQLQRPGIKLEPVFLLSSEALALGVLVLRKALTRQLKIHSGRGFLKGFFVETNNFKC